MMITPDLLMASILYRSRSFSVFLVSLKNDVQVTNDSNVILFLSLEI